MNQYIAGILLLLTMLSGCTEKQEPNVVSPPDIEAGKAIAQLSCSGCHGMDGRGVQDGIPNLAAQVEAYLLKAIQTYDHGTRAGSSGGAMRVVKELNSEQLRNVLAYYASLPSHGGRMSMSVEYSYYDRGEELSKSCVRCHGEGGNPAKAGMPRLAGQHPEYLIKAARAYQDGSRAMSSMHESLADSSQADLSNMAIYFALNKPQPAAGKAGHPYAGREYANECIKCHGATGSSEDAATPILAGQDATYLVNMIKAYRDKGRDHGAMHRIIGNLKDDEIRKIAGFFAAEQPVQIAFVPPEPVDSLARKCDRCHSQGDANPEMLAPRLEGQNRTYLINAMKAYRDGDRGNSAMHKISSVLYFDATIEGLANYYTAQAAK